MGERRPASFYWLAALFALFVLFLYGPMITILILSFQGPEGGLTFPMNGVSLHWFAKLWEGLGVVDIWAAFRRSLRLGFVVMVLTVVLSLLAGLAYRKRFRGLEHPVLRRDREPDRAVDRGLARHRPRIPPASTTPSRRWRNSSAGPGSSRTTPPRWTSTPPASARSSPGRCRSGC